MATRNEYFPQSRPHPGKTLFEEMEKAIKQPVKQSNTAIYA